MAEAEDLVGAGRQFVHGSRLDAGDVGAGLLGGYEKASNRIEDTTQPQKHTGAQESVQETAPAGG